MSSIAPPSPAFPKGADRSSGKKPKARTNITHLTGKLIASDKLAGGGGVRVHVQGDRNKAPHTSGIHIQHHVPVNTYMKSLRSKEIMSKSLTTKKYIYMVQQEMY